MTYKLRFILITMVALITASCLLLVSPLEISANDSREEKISKLSKWMKSQHDNGNFNGSILLLKEGKIIFDKNYGYEDVENKKALSSNSSFNLASVSKQFTAMGIMLLAEQESINYDDNISKYLPELSYIKGVTIRHLLHHTSGLPDYMELTDKYWDKLVTFKTSDLLRLLKKYKTPVKFKPNSKFEYSNTGYVLLSAIIERVTQQKYSDFMSKNIFQPLKMYDTAIFNLQSDSKVLKNRVYGFRTRGVFVKKKVYNDLNYLDGVAGDGAVYSSSFDLLKWHQSISKGTLLPLETYKGALTPGKLDDGEKTNYGYGWGLSHSKDGSHQHSGAWQGFSSYIYRSPKHDTLVVILDSSSNNIKVKNIRDFIESY